MVRSAESIEKELRESAERMKRVRKTAETEREVIAQAEAEPTPRTVTLTPPNPLRGRQS